MGITKFADLSKYIIIKLNLNISSKYFREEFVSTYASGLRGPLFAREDLTYEEPRPDIRLEDLPASVDWREQGVINPLRDQGMCGSCWAFAAAGAMEAYAKINDMESDLLELSPQHLTRSEAWAITVLWSMVL